MRMKITQQKQANNARIMGTPWRHTSSRYVLSYFTCQVWIRFPMVKLKQYVMAIYVRPQTDLKTEFILACEALYAILICYKTDGHTSTLPRLSCLCRIFLDQFTALQGTEILLFHPRSLHNWP
jgi:hypothetical protein